MRPNDNGNKIRRARRPLKSEQLFSLTNREIMADLMYGTGAQPARGHGR